MPELPGICCCSHSFQTHKTLNPVCEEKGCPCLGFIGIGSKKAHEAMTLLRLISTNKMSGVLFTYPEDLGTEAITLKALVEKQVKDENLWFEATTAPEGYLQQALRTLHSGEEGLKG